MRTIFSLMKNLIKLWKNHP